MSTNLALRQTSVVLIIAAAATLPASGSFARQPHIAPIQSHPHGQTYSEWAVDWWQVAVETPASVNPVLDETGENCDQGNQGNVWFLFGTFGGPVERTCQIPVGTALFFPLINRASLGEEGVDDLEEQRNNVNGAIDSSSMARK